MSEEQAVESAQTDVTAGAAGAASGAVDQTTGDTVPDAGEQSQEQTGVEQGAADQSHEKTVPLTALEAERQKRQQLEFQLNQMTQQQPPQQQLSQKDMVMQQYGLEQSDIVESDKLAQILASERQAFAKALESLQYQSKHKDFTEVVGDGQQFATPLMERLNANPNLMRALKSSPDWQELAYEIGSLQKQVRVVRPLNLR